MPRCADVTPVKLICHFAFFSASSLGFLLNNFGDWCFIGVYAVAFGQI
jgi:hypothetical protein